MSDGRALSGATPDEGSSTRKRAMTAASYAVNANAAKRSQHVFNNCIPR